MVTVKPLKVQGESTLVEWWDENGRVYRGYIPTNEIEDNTTTQEAVAMAIPYGAPWAEMFGGVTFSADELETQLHRHGVWEQRDLLAKPNKVMAAISAVYGLTLGELIKLSKEQNNG